MKILLLGGTGLIGSALLPALIDQGYSLRVISRSGFDGNTLAGMAEGQLEIVRTDIAAWTRPADWQAALFGVDSVINAVGIFAENAQQSFAQLHIAMPKALFAACALYGVGRVIHVSALGADANATTDYWRSKGEADAALIASDLDWAIMRPSLIYAPQGRSCQQFLTMASWPVLPDLRGSAAVQPVHLDDVIAAIVALLDTPGRQLVNLVGPSAMSLTQWLAALRQGMGLATARHMPVYRWMQDISALVAQYLPGSLLSPASMTMLRVGNVADQAPLQQLLGHPLKAAIPSASDVGLASRSQLAWLIPLLRYTMAAVWLMTAAVCWWGWPHAQSLALLAQLGVPQGLQWPLFVGAIVFDFVLGLTCLWPRWRTWKLQIALVLGYSALIAWGLPEYLLHPFGPVLKNLPILALLLVLDQCDSARG